jgi:hypothetical protein
MDIDRTRIYLCKIPSPLFLLVGSHVLFGFECFFTLSYLDLDTHVHALWACYFLAGIIQQQQVVAVGGGCGGDEDSLERHFDLSQFFLIFFFIGV